MANGGAWKKKLKDVSPHKTVIFIKSLLCDFPANISEIWHSTSYGAFHSLKLSIDGTHLSVNGKGTSRALARASAYAELMERLQNFYLYRQDRRIQESIKNKATLQQDYHVSWQEIITRPNCYLPEIAKTVSNFRFSKLKKITSEIFGNIDITIDDSSPINLNILEDYLFSDGEKKIEVIPFYNVFRQRIELFPRTFLSLYGSNGMCAGNSLSEALVQGLSEIFERHVAIKIINEKICPPSIPSARYINNLFLRPFLDKISCDDNYQLMVKDCSLGKGYPVLAAALINRSNQAYSVTFGSHPLFEIALERTFTEKYQLRSQKDHDALNFYSVCDPALANPYNVSNLLKAGVGSYPQEFFEDCALKPSNSFFKTHGTSNLKLSRKLLNIYKVNGLEVLIRDVSFLGFPSYQIIVPGFSEIFTSSLDGLYNYSSRLKISRIMRDLENATDEQLDFLLNFALNRRFSIGENRIDYLYDLPLDDSTFPGGTMQFDFLASVIWYKRGSLEKSLKHLHVVMQYSQEVPGNHFSKSYYSCLAHFLTLKRENKTYVNIHNFLSRFYRIEIITEIFRNFEDSKICLSKIYPSCRDFDCGRCSLNHRCCYLNVDKILEWAYCKMEQNVVRQEDLKNSTAFLYS